MLIMPSLDTWYDKLCSTEVGDISPLENQPLVIDVTISDRDGLVLMPAVKVGPLMLSLPKILTQAVQA